jgi:hypothetical protein
MLSAPPATTRSLSPGGLQAGLDDGLQSRPAAPVDLHTGHGHRQAGVEGHDPPDRRRLTVGVAVSEDDIVDRLRGHPGAIEQSRQRGDAEVDGRQ